MMLTLRHRAHLNQVRLVQIDAPIVKRRPIPQRLYVLGYAIGLAMLICAVLP